MFTIVKYARTGAVIGVFRYRKGRVRRYWRVRSNSLRRLRNLFRAQPADFFVWDMYGDERFAGKEFRQAYSLP